VSGAPVIVWLHPGAFANASANFPPQNGAKLAALTGTIVVAPNYRLGPFPSRQPRHKNGRGQ
jgi:carboxylesterase type B